MGFVLLFGTLRREFERDMRSSVVEQRAADEIMVSVYGQLLASYQQLQNPSDRNRERFDSLGQIAYTHLRQYLFQPMAIEPRLQVETIKELHETLEVDAHRAFDLVRRGEADAARVHISDMESRAARLEREMGRFVALRERERAQRHDDQVSSLQRWVAGLALLVVALAVYALWSVHIVKDRVVRPLVQLSDASVQLGTGDLSARIPPQRHEELATVARSFNEMAVRMQAARAEVEAHNRELGGALHDLREAQQNLVQQEKMGAIGVMLAGLAHELNNPLAGVLGSAEIIEHELGAHADPAVRLTVKEVVQPLVAEARRAADLVRNLLQFSRKANPDLHVVNLKAAIDVAAGLRAFAFAQAGKALAIGVPDDLYVEAEAQRLEHVTLNIMSNALDAMRGGTGTTLFVRAGAVEPGWVTLSFVDDGPGFGNPERVFDPFYTTKAAGAGTGLGLTLVHRFVTEAGGTIHVTNAALGGASVTIRLRAAAAPSPAAAVTTAVPLRTTPRPVPVARPERTVLVVDDELALRNIQRRFLAKLGVRVHVAADGAEAKAILLREHCDVVVTDIRMPGEMDGIALYHWIEQAQPDLAERCLFVSGDLADWDEGSVLRTHPERFISKPFNRADYLARVGAVLDRQAAAD